MLGIAVRFDVLDEQAGEEFDRLTEVAVARIREREPGTLTYATHRVKDEPLARLFYEVYVDEAAWQTHEAGSHVKEFHAAKDVLLSRPARVEFLHLAPQGS